MSEVSLKVITAESIVRLAQGVRLREDKVRGQTVLLGPEKAIALDDIATAIVKALDGERSLATIAAALATDYEAPQDQVLTDMLGFVSEFSNRGLLEVRE